jgi:nucleotide-binding universal stress UspA family protein
VAKKETTAKRFLHKASEKLNHAGIAPERIKTDIQISGYNIAGAIQHTAARDMMDSILVGRQGLNAISEMLMGSVSLRCQRLLLCQSRCLISTKS